MTHILSETTRRLFSLLVQSVFLTKSTILLCFHSVRMVLLIFGQIVVTLFTFCTFQSNLSTHLVTSVIHIVTAVRYVKILGIKKRPNSSLEYYNTMIRSSSIVFSGFEQVSKHRSYRNIHRLTTFKRYLFCIRKRIVIRTNSNKILF